MSSYNHDFSLFMVIDIIKLCIKLVKKPEKFQFSFPFNYHTSSYLRVLDDVMWLESSFSKLNVFCFFSVSILVFKNLQTGLLFWLGGVMFYGNQRNKLKHGLD